MAEAGAIRQPDAPAARDASPGWAHLLTLPCDLTVDLLLPQFTVGDLTRLQAGVVVDSHWNVGKDVPLRVNGQLIAWSEFEVTGNRLAVRLTELA